MKRALAASLLIAVTSPLLVAATTPPEIEDYGEIHRHLIEPIPVVMTPWADISAEHRYLSWSFDLTVDERGIVSAAELNSGGRDYRDEATRIARALRFTPFIRDGRPTPVRLEFMIGSRSADYAGPADRGFPLIPDPSTTVIALARTGCYGTCPAYRVELRGDGEVTYQGESDVLVRGLHRWRVDPAAISPLIELLRRGSYFELKGYYEYPVTDLPTYITRLSIGDRHKFVLDYGGSGFGGAAASTQMGDEDPDMPPVVTEIENAIDQIAGTASYVSGDGTSLNKLRAEHWNFRSQDAGHALRILLSDCKTAIARELIRAGAPIDITGQGYGARLPIAFAAHCADVDLVKLMVTKGALVRASDARTFLWASVSSGDPAMVELALKHDGNVNAKTSEGTPLLADAAGSYVNDDAVNAAKFDSAKVVELLVAAGANPNSRDADGKTPIFEASDAAVASALLRKGADPNARDNDGQTALFDRYFDEPKSALLAAGADVNARDKAGRTALFYQDDPVSIKVLLDAGADIEAVDSKGHTAIEQMNSEAATSALLDAGAKLPADLARLNAMIAHASERKWTSLQPRLQAAAGK
jgi:ankyrin repeat protein